MGRFKLILAGCKSYHLEAHNDHYTGIKKTKFEQLMKVVTLRSFQNKGMFFLLLLVNLWRDAFRYH